MFRRAVRGRTLFQGISSPRDGTIREILGLGAERGAVFSLPFFFALGKPRQNHRPSAIGFLGVANEKYPVQHFHPYSAQHRGSGDDADSDFFRARRLIGRPAHGFRAPNRCILPRVVVSRLILFRPRDNGEDEFKPPFLFQQGICGFVLAGFFCQPQLQGLVFYSRPFVFSQEIPENDMPFQFRCVRLTSVKMVPDIVQNRSRFNVHSF